jgi:hypothetical protein
MTWIKAHNVKLLLYAFKQASRLKINFHKSELFCFGEAHVHQEYYTKLFGCKAGNFPINFLGTPIHYNKLRNNDWKKIEERFEKRFSGWKGKHLSVGGHLVVINLVLSSLPLYMMSFFSKPKESLRSWTFFAQDYTSKG